MIIEVDILGVHQFYNLDTHEQQNTLVISIMGEEVRIPCTEDQLQRWVQQTTAEPQPQMSGGQLHDEGDGRFSVEAGTATITAVPAAAVWDGFGNEVTDEEPVDPDWDVDEAIADAEGAAVTFTSAPEPAEQVHQFVGHNILGGDILDEMEDDAPDPARPPPRPTATQQRLKGIEAQLGARPYQKHATNKKAAHAKLRAAAKAPIKRKPQPKPTQAAPVNTDNMFGDQG